VLLEVGHAVFVAGHPRVEIRDRVGPGAERHAAVRQVVVFLDRAVQGAVRQDGIGEPPRRETGEVVAEQLDRDAGIGRRLCGVARREQQ